MAKIAENPAFTFARLKLFWLSNYVGKNLSLYGKNIY